MDEDLPRQPEPPAHPFGTTMRIDISPEMIEDGRTAPGKGEAAPKPRPLLRVPKPRDEIAAAGVDFQQLLQNIYDAAFITAVDGEILLVNARANHSFRAQSEDLTHRNILAYICGADESLLPTILETLEGNRFVLMQALCMRTDGTFFPTEISVNRLKLGDRDRLSFFIRDITLRKEQEEKLRTGNTAIQNASSGIAIAGMDLRVEYCNPAFRDMFSLDDATTAGRDVRSLLCEPEKLDDVLKMTAGQETWEGEMKMLRADTETFFGRASVTPNLNSDGEQVGIVLSILDVTAQKLAQQQLEDYAAELRIRNQQMQEDLDVAGELTEALLPAHFHSFPADCDPDDALLHFRHCYLPNGRIGGDFFDILHLSEHEVGLFIADVMGHGVRSALVVATIRGLIEELRPIARDPGAMLTQLNANYTAIFKKMGSDVTFATALYGVMDTRTGVWRFANASHPLPYVLRRAESRLERVRSESQGTAALGLLSGTEYTSGETSLFPEDILLLYTDGLAEAENPAHELYETRRLEETLREHLQSPGASLLESIVRDAQKFSDPETLEDDVCLVSMQVLALAGSP